MWTVSGRLELSPGLSDRHTQHLPTPCNSLQKWSTESRGTWRDSPAVGTDGGGKPGRIGISESHRISQGEQVRPIGHPWTFLRAEETGSAGWNQNNYEISVLGAFHKVAAETFSSVHLSPLCAAGLGPGDPVPGTAAVVSAGCVGMTKERREVGGPRFPDSP